MALTYWRRPWESGFPALKHEIDKIFDDFFAKPVFATVGEEDWLPAANVRETDRDVVVIVDAPSIDPGTISISVEGDKLTIKGERDEEKETSGSTYYQSERLHGTFRRVIQLPVPVLPDKAKAAYRDGVLTITIPKVRKRASKETKITIK